MATQCDTLVRHFMIKGSITAVEAQAVYRIRSLSRRICDLTSRGHRFRKIRSVDPTGQQYVRYHYLGKLTSRQQGIGMVA